MMGELDQILRSSVTVLGKGWDGQVSYKIEADDDTVRTPRRNRTMNPNPRKRKSPMRESRNQEKVKQRQQRQMKRRKRKRSQRT
jgi:hypothetical protein